MVAVPVRTEYFIIFFSLGKQRVTGCKQYVSLDIFRNNFLSAADIRSSVLKYGNKIPA